MRPLGDAGSRGHGPMRIGRAPETQFVIVGTSSFSPIQRFDGGLQGPVLVPREPGSCGDTPPQAGTPVPSSKDAAKPRISARYRPSPLRNPRRYSKVPGYRPGRGEGRGRGGLWGPVRQGRSCSDGAQGSRPGHGFQQTGSTWTADAIQGRNNEKKPPGSRGAMHLAWESIPAIRSDRIPGLPLCQKLSNPHARARHRDTVGRSPARRRQRHIQSAQGPLFGESRSCWKFRCCVPQTPVWGVP